MGKGDNRQSAKMARRKNQAKKRERMKKRAAGIKAQRKGR